jgi:hypothetical protein
VFCAPSLHGESFGVVLIEAMAAGTPVVASSLPGYQNVATHDVDALLVPPGDPAALGSALRTALFERATAERLRQAGERRSENFSMEALAAEYIEIYDRVLTSDWRATHRSGDQSVRRRVRSVVRAARWVTRWLLARVERWSPARISRIPGMKENS